MASTPIRRRQQKPSRQLRDDLLQEQVSLHKKTYEALLQSFKETRNVSEQLLSAQKESNKLKTDLLEKR